MKEINPYFNTNIIYEVSGYKVTYGDDWSKSYNDNDEWSNGFDAYEDLLFTTYKQYSPESDSERKERELKEKAINREKKINQILGE